MFGSISTSQTTSLILDKSYNSKNSEEAFTGLLNCNKESELKSLLSRKITFWFNEKVAYVGAIES